MKYILGGHWTNPPEGWVALSEQDQDITAPLQWGDNSVDVLFTEHTLEHVSLTDGILFFREAARVLKPGGILRTVCPFVNQLVKYDDSTEVGKHYAQTQLRHYYPNEDAALKELGLDFANYGQQFMFDSLLKKHNHQMVWSSTLMMNVLASSQIGFNMVHTTKPGISHFDQTNCLERVLRGVAPDWAEANNITEYDPESLVIEAKK